MAPANNVWKIRIHFDAKARFPMIECRIRGMCNLENVCEFAVLIKIPTSTDINTEITKVSQNVTPSPLLPPLIPLPPSPASGPNSGVNHATVTSAPLTNCTRTGLSMSAARPSTDARSKDTRSLYAYTFSSSTRAVCTSASSMYRRPKKSSDGAMNVVVAIRVDKMSSCANECRRRSSVAANECPSRIGSDALLQRQTIRRKSPQ